MIDEGCIATVSILFISLLIMWVLDISTLRKYYQEQEKNLDAITRVSDLERQRDDMARELTNRRRSQRHLHPDALQ